MKILFECKLCFLWYQYHGVKYPAKFILTLSCLFFACFINMIIVSDHRGLICYYGGGLHQNAMSKAIL